MRLPDPIRSDVDAWDVAGFIGGLATMIDSGYKALRKQVGLLQIYEDSVVGTFIANGLVQFLYFQGEALDLLVEIAPSVADVNTLYSADVGVWRKFRDDAAHVVDRTFRVSPGRHDAVYSDPKFGPGTLVLGYNYGKDQILTGDDPSAVLNLGKAVRKAPELSGAVSRRLSEETQKGTVPKPNGVR